jgi:hypothetical protein
MGWHAQTSMRDGLVLAYQDFLAQQKVSSSTKAESIRLRP